MKTHPNSLSTFLVVVVAAPILPILLGPPQAKAAPVVLQNASATFSQTGHSVSTAIDGLTSGAGGWAIFPQIAQNQTAVFETQTDVDFLGVTFLTFTLHMDQGFSHTLGRFRLSATTDNRSTFADGLQSGGDVTANWIVLDPTTATSQNGATLTEQPDLSILASGVSPATDIYTITTSASIAAITGFRVEAIADPSLPSGGPGRQNNGNFHLTELIVDAVPEPSSALLAAFGFLALLACRGRLIKTQCNCSGVI